MDALDLQTRCSVLSAGDGDVELALKTLDEKLGEWFGVLGRLSAGAARVSKPERAPQPAVAAAPAPAPAPAEVQAPAAPEEDEEALLASLDPEIANAVRVKRRLLGTRCSVRQLIAEVEASRSAKRDKPRGKSWWR